MARGKKHSPEQVVNTLRQIEVAVANGKTTPQACKEAGIVEQTYSRWRKEDGGLQVDQARRLKEPEQENSKLKRLVAELSLDKVVLKTISGQTMARSSPPRICSSGWHSSLGYRPPAPEAWLTSTNAGHGKVESQPRFPLSHTPDCGYLSPQITALH